MINLKSAGLYIHKLLGLPDHARVIELKQACYGATAGLQLAKSLLANNNNLCQDNTNSNNNSKTKTKTKTKTNSKSQKILLIASDIARYGLILLVSLRKVPVQ